MVSENEQILETVVVKDDNNLKELIPSMNVGLPAEKTDANEGKELISDQQLLGLYGEILEDIKSDGKKIEEVLDNFVNMVLNEGDSSPASKEALVNCLKMKVDQADKKIKVGDLMTRVRMKERDTFPRYLAANQNNTINIGDSGQKRALLEAIGKAKKDKDKENK